eukprot:UN18903
MTFGFPALILCSSIVFSNFNSFISVFVSCIPFLKYHFSLSMHLVGRGFNFFIFSSFNTLFGENEY